MRAEQRDPPAPRSLTAACALLVTAAALTLVRSFDILLDKATRPHPMTPYVAPQYWLSYRHGFVRRALPGELLHVLMGGAAPTYPLVKVVGVGLSVAAVLAVIVLAVMLARRAPTRAAGVAIAAAVLSSPLSLSLLARDVGRLDAAGVVLVVVLVGLPWDRLASPLVALGVAVLAAAAVASEEFLLAFVLPLAVLVAWQSLGDRRFGRAWTVVAVAPCLVVTAISAAVKPPARLLEETTAAARAAGVPPPVPMAPGQVDHDSVSRLKYGFVENMQAYYALTSPVGVVVTTAIWTVVYALLAGLVWHLLGRSVRQRAFVVVTTGFALGAVALSVAGIDYRRWWTLAMVAVLAASLRLTTSEGRPVSYREGPWLTAAAGGVALIGAVLYYMPLFPLSQTQLAAMLAVWR